jgi:hypothetical protein
VTPSLRCVSETGDASSAAIGKGHLAALQHEMSAPPNIVAYNSARELRLISESARGLSTQQYLAKGRDLRFIDMQTSS